ncbi:membrane protein [Streptomyces virginiae]|uniref:Membrane protein n=1 Tax=Streptomyces virginiae TaxID=1961 RepID=A0ABQ3NMX2_STRVG|nr:NfeD family protein [Streptomyces virginiae]MBP2342003.1 membrane protein implicated in regulation of membrane protease activity [Streptomyces virginiae]GGQ33790.1 membrane protein [Streptomyces virginiae]GHI14120.1 membrane protein [Streptomyces virginiae]
MDAWLIWLITAVLLGAAEIFTLTIALGLLGGAALVTAALAALGLPVFWQFLVFALVATAGVVFVRPMALRRLTPRQSERFGVDALIGGIAYVTAEVTARDGRVRIGGEEWTARAYDETLVKPPGTTVDVIEIKGSTALVYPRE